MIRNVTLLLALSALLCLPAGAQTPAEPPSTPSPLPPTQAPAPLSPERKDVFPNLNLYMPEGEFDIKVRKLVKNVLFEGQVKYGFVDGDISTFLRYKYYASSFTYRLGVFDTVEFDSIDSGSNDFDRVRGGLLLFEFPKNYNQRYFFLTQVDGLTYGDVTKPDNNRKNVYAKLGFQVGTPFDERLNAIVGETRGRTVPVLTAYRDIGAQKLGFAVGLTQSLDFAGDYNYTRLETEGLKRIDFRNSSFIFSRLHVGSFLQKQKIAGREEEPEFEQYTVPRYEFFKLGGREALKGVDDSHRGSDEIHWSNEYFVPIFRNRDFKTSIIRWNNLYAITYVGAGSIGFSSSTFTDFDRYVFDAGLGFESSMMVRDYEIYLTAVYAQTVKSPAELEGSEIRFSARTSR